jgi:hypothetical protein
MSTQSVPRSHVAEILSRIVGPEEGNLTPETAKAILKLKLDEADCQRAHELAVRNQEGKLTKTEEAELEAYQRVGRLIDLLSAKARRSLKRAGLDKIATGDE